MGHQIIRQPDGKGYAVFSSVIDDWIIFDADHDELVQYYRDEAATEAERAVRAKLAEVDDPNNSRPYFQFTMTFEEAQELRASVHGSADWPPDDGEPIDG